MCIQGEAYLNSPLEVNFMKFWLKKKKEKNCSEYTPTV